MRIRSIALAGMALALTSMPVLAAPAKKAAAKAPAAAAAAPADAQAQHAMLYLKVLISALQSDKVEEPVKGALVGCIYDNPLSKITESMDKVIAENTGKISRDNPSQLLSVMAQICGYRPDPAAPGQPATPATPAQPSTPKGR